MHLTSTIDTKFQQKNIKQIRLTTTQNNKRLGLISRSLPANRYAHKLKDHIHLSKIMHKQGFISQIQNQNLSDQVGQETSWTHYQVGTWDNGSQVVQRFTSGSTAKVLQESVLIPGVTIKTQLWYLPPRHILAQTNELAVFMSAHFL